MEGNSIHNENYYGAPDQNMSQQPGGPPGMNRPRPMVVDDEMGEVDLSKYGESTDATKKVRGRSDIMEMVCGNTSQELLIAKAFYFFFFSAFGSLFPLMGVYFKQLGLNPAQCGILAGLRPIIEYVSGPFWSQQAER